MRRECVHACRVTRVAARSKTCIRGGLHYCYVVIYIGDPCLHISICPAGCLYSLVPCHLGDYSTLGLFIPFYGPDFFLCVPTLGDFSFQGHRYLLPSDRIGKLCFCISHFGLSVSLKSMISVMYSIFLAIQNPLSKPHYPNFHYANSITQMAWQALHVRWTKTSGLSFPDSSEWFRDGQVTTQDCWRERTISATHPPWVLVAGLIIKSTQDRLAREEKTNLIPTRGGLRWMVSLKWPKQAVCKSFLCKETIICEDLRKGLLLGVAD